MTTRTFRIRPDSIEAFVARLEQHGQRWQSWPKVANGRTLWADISTDANLHPEAFPEAAWLTE